jgi:hypothetical protein
MAILADILQKTQMIATSTVIKSFLMAILAAHHSTMKVIWMLTKTIMLMTAVMVAITQVVVRHRPVTSVIYVTMYILVMKITMATAPHPHVMWYWTPMKIGKNTVTMIQITVLNRQMVMTAMKNMANTPSETALLLLKDVDHIGLAMKNSLFGMTPMLTAIIYLIK